jgi:hypothetical protein
MDSLKLGKDLRELRVAHLKKLARQYKGLKEQGAALRMPAMGCDPPRSQKKWWSPPRVIFLSA